MADPEVQEETEDLDQLEQAARDTEDDLLKGAFERTRDPQTGRFTKAAQADQPEQPETGQPAEQAEEKPSPEAKPEAKPDDEVLPSWRAREINEERRRTQADLEALRVEHARLQAWANQQQRAAQPAQPAAPDPMLDPAAYTKHVQDQMRAEFASQLAHDRLNNNLEITHMRHGERFEKAFEALVGEGQRGNNQLVRHLIGQSNPGEAVMRWFNQNEVMREVGGDPSAYAEKIKQSLLNDSEFLSLAAERAREVATGGQPKPNTVVKIPPSLSKATGSAEIPQTATDGSDAAIFEYAMQSKRRR